MPFEVYPTPAKGKDGRNILFARPAGGRFMRITEEQIDNYVAKYSLLNRGQLRLMFAEFKRWAAEMMAKGYRIDTPIGSFAPKLRMKGEFTDPAKVGHDDVELDGVEYSPGKIWHKAIDEWMHDGFRKVDRPEASKLLADKERLEQLMRDTIQRHGGVITANTFSIVSCSTSGRRATVPSCRRPASGSRTSTRKSDGHRLSCRLILRKGEEILRTGTRSFAYRRKAFCV